MSVLATTRCVSKLKKCKQGLPPEALAAPTAASATALLRRTRSPSDGMTSLSLLRSSTFLMSPDSIASCSLTNTSRKRHAP